MPTPKIQLWKSEVLREFTDDSSFLSEVPNKSNLVKYDAIHLSDLDIETEVMVDNEIIYPVPTVAYHANDVILKLRKLRTTNTSIAEEDLFAVSHSPMQETVQEKGEKLKTEAGKLGAHALTPFSHTEKSPVLQATGIRDDVTDRYVLTRQDVLRLSTAMGKAKVPNDNRVLVLTPQHKEDLMLDDNTFSLLLHDYKGGDLLGMYYGFKIYSYNGQSAVFRDKSGTFERVAYSGKGYKTADGGTYLPTDLEASFAFYKPRTIKAIGSTTMFWKSMAQNPETDSAVIGFLQRVMIQPKKKDAIGALISPPRT